MQQEDSSWGIFATGGLWVFYGTLYGFYDATRCYLCNNTYISINIWNLSHAYLQQEASSWGIFATGGLWVFCGTLYGFYDVTRCYLCNNTYISINIWNLEKQNNTCSSKVLKWAGILWIKLKTIIK